MKLAVITTVSGRHSHLRLQLAGLAESRRRPDEHVVVAMDDPPVAAVCGTSATVVSVRTRDGRLPLAAARNEGAKHALSGGAELLVFLDVDCVPAPQMLGRYEQAALAAPNALLSGAVRYLPPPPEQGYRLDELPVTAVPHPARGEPATEEMLPLDHALFWSLSFAVPATTWARIGGFYAGYHGYGAEDTDFGQLARCRGVGHVAVGGAVAYHQWHPSPQPPVQHLADIVRNGRIFRDRWGWWPMTGWLDEFAELGLVVHDPVSDDWLIQPPGRARSQASASGTSSGS